MSYLSALDLRPFLKDCGYRPSLLVPDFRFGDDRRVPLAAFAHPPTDARSACVAVLDAPSEPRSAVLSCRQIGAPIVFVCYSDLIQWWKQGTDAPRIERTVPIRDVPRFFNENSPSFSPDAVYRAKTWGRFETQHQLSFVDVGLMPLVEEETGAKLEELIVRCVAKLKSSLNWQSVSAEQGQWLLQSVFWLVSAKILRDKELDRFQGLNLEDVDDVFRRIAEHYRANEIPISSSRKRNCLRSVAGEMESFSRLNLATTESLAHVYENALITKETRAHLGTHSTPPYLVDYVLGKLRPWIEEIPVSERNVLEPACGHAAFLVSAMRLLTELLPYEKASPSRRRRYLRSRLHGCDIDAFALEIARLALTLTDIPNPDGWDLQLCDMFASDFLESKARECTILLGNPPFENFSPQERNDYQERGVAVRYVSRSAEVLARVLPNMPPNSVLGFVVPQGMLHSRNARALRELLLKEFEISEICLFPDKMFAFSDMESALVLGRKRSPTRRALRTLDYRRVRERDIGRFRSLSTVTSECRVQTGRFNSTNDWEIRIPDLEEVWEYLQDRPKLSEIAELGQGLAYKSIKNLPDPNVVLDASEEFSGSEPGFLTFDVRTETAAWKNAEVSYESLKRRPIQLHELPTAVRMNLDASVILRSRTGTQTRIPQVLLNYAPVSRGPWRLKALLDKDGHAVTSRFVTVRPTTQDLPLIFLWALCNSPVSNAYAFCHLGKRDNLVGDLRESPVPASLPDEAGRVTQLAESLLGAIRDAERQIPSASAVSKDEIRALLLELDAEVLRLYNLPAALEWKLLDLFAGRARPGIPISFDRYFPEGFELQLSLREYLAISQNWDQTNRRRGELIEKKVNGRITGNESDELGQLQQAATYRRQLEAPYPIRELEEIRGKLEAKLV